MHFSLDGLVEILHKGERFGCGCPRLSPFSMLSSHAGGNVILCDGGNVDFARAKCIILMYNTSDPCLPWAYAKYDFSILSDH